MIKILAVLYLSCSALLAQIWEGQIPFVKSEEAIQDEGPLNLTIEFGGEKLKINGELLSEDALPAVLTVFKNQIGAISLICPKEVADEIVRTGKWNIRQGPKVKTKFDRVLKTITEKENISWNLVVRVADIEQGAEPAEKEKE